jgi:hypothetical protein
MNDFTPFLIYTVEEFKWDTIKLFNSVNLHGYKTPNIIIKN